MRPISFYFIGLLLALGSCRSDFETVANDLIFSRDTIYLDTVFTDIGSSTYRLKVYIIAKTTSTFQQ
jgi:hypothetical protein